MIFWTVAFAVILVLDIRDFIQGKDSLLKLIFNLAIILFVGWANIYYNLHDLKHIGKYDPDADDEHDEFISQKTNHQVLKIIENLFLFGGFIPIIAGIKVTNDTLSAVLIFIGIFMELMWWIIMILKTIVYLINYKKY